MMLYVLRDTSYTSWRMIQSFKSEDAKELFETGKARRWVSIQVRAKRKLDQLETAIHLSDLRSPPGNRLEAPQGSRSGEYSIRINDQFRICFVWKSDGAYDVEITDYHETANGVAL